MIRKVMPVVLLAAFISGPMVAPAYAAGDKATAKCEQIKDAKLKAQCLRDARKPAK